MIKFNEIINFVKMTKLAGEDKFDDVCDIYNVNRCYDDKIITNIHDLIPYLKNILNIKTGGIIDRKYEKEILTLLLKFDNDLYSILLRKLSPDEIKNLNDIQDISILIDEILFISAKYDHRLIDIFHADHDSIQDTIRKFNQMKMRSFSDYAKEQSQKRQDSSKPNSNHELFNSHKGDKNV